MRVFVYEYLVALGLGRDAGDPFHPMYREGLAMRDALVADLVRIAGVEVRTLDAAAEEDHEEQITQIAERCDWSIIIAPELGGELERCCWSVWSSTGKLLGPSSEAVRLLSDKFATFEHWQQHGVPTPATSLREPTPCEAFPVVWKPRDGAGSTASFLLRSAMELHQAKALIAAGEHTGEMILQHYVPGRAASAAFLCGPAGHYPLLPAFQVLSDDGRLKYLGGELPIEAALAERVQRVATRALECVPGLLGYIGVDVTLGNAADGSQDVVIEINPRLTTSYVGLRAAANFNLAEAMLEIAAGRTPTTFSWNARRLRWWPNGTIHERE